MSRFGLPFHHVGFAVAGPQPAARLLADLGYAVGEAVRDPEQNVYLLLCTHTSMPTIEMISPTKTPGPLGNLLKAQTELSYPLAYVCDGVEQAVRWMRKEGHRVVALTAERLAVLFGGRRVVFFRVAGPGMIELIEAGPARAAS